MIKTLRRRFVAVNMILVTAVLLIAFGFLVFSTWRSEKATTEEMLIRVADMTDVSKDLPKRQIGGWSVSGASGAQSGAFPPDSQSGDAVRGNDGMFDLSSVFWVTTDANGTITASGTSNVDISSDTLASVTAAAFAKGAGGGTLSSPDLRYYVKQTSAGYRIIFTDRSGEISTLRGLVLRLLVILAAILAAFFGISVFLSGLALRPAQTAWEQQRQFVADASHELKTPLTVILANADILHAHPNETVGSESKWVDGISDEGGRMKKLIDELLYLAKSDAGRTPVMTGRIDLSDAVMSSALSFESVAYEKGISLETQIQPNVSIQGDESSIKRLTAILVDNACKYAGGDRRVFVRLSSSAGGAVLAVTNPGETISPEELPHIFERFYRTDKSRSKGGYGLGLAIAQTIVQDHGGTITAASGNGQTTFTVSLPTDADAAARAKKKHRAV